MVMQAEHIPVHLGAMPGGRGRGAARGPRARATPGSSTTPTAAAPTCPTSRWSRRCSHDGELSGFAASRAHHADVGAREPGQHARRLAHARGRGRGDSAHAARTRGRAGPRAARGADRRCATRASARPTCAPSWPPNRAGGERAGRARASATASTPCAPAMRETLDYAERRTRARIAELEDGEREAHRRARGRRRRPRAARCARRSPATRSSSTSPARADQHDGNLNCPLAVTAVRLLLRPARAHRSRRARPAPGPTGR